MAHPVYSNTSWLAFFVAEVLRYHKFGNHKFGCLFKYLKEVHLGALNQLNKQKPRVKEFCEYGNASLWGITVLSSASTYCLPFFENWYSILYRIWWVIIFDCGCKESIDFSNLCSIINSNWKFVPDYVCFKENA